LRQRDYSLGQRALAAGDEGQQRTERRLRSGAEFMLNSIQA
jgi:hypothetical protein